MPSAQSLPDIAQPGRLQTRLALGSLGINVLLIALLLCPMSRRSPSAASDSLPPDPTDTGKATTKNLASAIGQASSARRAMSVWSQIESHDFREFAANLRQAGCSEETLCDVIRPAILRSFNGRKGPLAQGGNFWATGESRRALRANAAVAEIRQNDEQDHLLAELACPIDFLEKEDNNFEERLLIELATGFLNRSAQRALLQLIMDSERITDRWTQRTRGILLPGDVAALERERADLRQRLSQVLSEAEREEVDLRAWHLSKGERFIEDERLRHLRLTPSELREFSRITSGGEVSLLTQLLDLHQFFDDSPPLLTETEVSAQLIHLLGDERYSQYQKDHDYIFNAAEQLAEQHHLPSAAAGAVYQAFREFRAALAPLRAAWSADRQQARQALLEQREQMRARLDVILADAPEPVRQKALSSWIDLVIQEIWHKP